MQQSQRAPVARWCARSRCHRLLEFKQDEIDNIYDIVAAVLYLGDITYRDVGERKCEVENKEAMSMVARLLQVGDRSLARAPVL